MTSERDEVGVDAFMQLMFFYVNKEDVVKKEQILHSVPIFVLNDNIGLLVIIEKLLLGGKQLETVVIQGFLTPLG